MQATVSSKQRSSATQTISVGETAGASSLEPRARVKARGSMSDKDAHSESTPSDSSTMDTISNTTSLIGSGIVTLAAQSLQ
jgi:hypothetical protein